MKNVCEALNKPPLLKLITPFHRDSLCPMQRTQDIATYCPGAVTATIMVDGMDDPLPE